MTMERIHQFGTQQRLIGIVTTSPHPGRTGCLIVNAGVIHRVGPHRINVKLARALAALGLTTMRIDLSGVGDSRLATGGFNYIDQAVADIGEALNLLEREHRIERFLLVGACSGAVNACAAALCDPRVAGVVLFDGYAFPTWKTPIARVWMSFRSTPWQGLLAATLHSLRLRLRQARMPTEPAAPAPVSGNGTVALDRRAFGDAMATLAGRGTRVCLLLSGSIPYYYTYAGQMRDTYGHEPWYEQLSVEFMTDVDHTMTTLHAQRRFVDAVVAWAGDVTQAVPSRPGRAPVSDSITPPTV